MIKDAKTLLTMFIVKNYKIFVKVSFKILLKKLYRQGNMTEESFMDVLPIDNESNSSFLNVSLLQKLIDIISSCSSVITKQDKKKEVIKQVKKYFTFEKVFSNRGVQGITGILKVKNVSDKVVFKISIDLDRSVEHENLVTKDLNRIRKYCPHFVGNIGMINIPVSNDFINEPDEESLFKNSNDYFPCNVLLIEYVSPISFYHICKYLHDYRGVIISQLVQIMMALDVAQVKCKFTSYDLHLDNILIRQIENDSLFLYKHRGKNVLVPTYGLYPVIIDLGSSYVKAIEGYPMYTSADNYQNGLQPTLYDNLNDIHHLITSVLYYLEDKSYAYDFLRNRFLYLFRHIPILSQKGWKQLPYDILELIIEQIRHDCPNIDKYEVFKDYDTDIVNILNGLIILPWSEHGDVNFNNCMEDFIGELQKIQEMKAISSTDDVLYILRETVDSINMFRELYESNKTEAIDGFVKEWKSRILFIVSGFSRAIPKEINFEKLFVSAINVSNRMSSNYYKYIQSHVELINDAYLQTDIKCPYDAAKVLLQNATPGFKVTKSSKIYIWDSDKENRTVLVPEMLTDSQLEIIDNSTIFRKGDRLVEFLNC